MPAIEDSIRLVKQAQQGDSQALENLVKTLELRLHEYVNRLTLDEELTREIAQDSLTKMIEELPNLRQPEQLWPWLSKIALNKIRRFYRDDGRHQAVHQSRQSQKASAQRQYDVVADAITKELRQIVLATMRQLKPKHRLVLVLRCYEQLPYREIASRLDVSEFKARALFARAKHALGKNLAKSGLGKGSLLGALLLFGKLTATSEVSAANLSISGAAIQVGWLPALTALVAHKPVTWTLAVLASAATLGSGTFGVWAGAHRATQPYPMAYGQNTEDPTTPGQLLYYYYPSHAGDVVQIQIRSTDLNEAGKTLWLQNEHANYARSGNRMLTCNAHLWYRDGRVMRLPTDSPKLTAFLNEREGLSHVPRTLPYDPRGMMVVQEGMESWRVLPQYDTADEGSFRGQWPQQLKVVDQRDEKHKRGWTPFRIEGYLGDDTITGMGHLPLVYAAYQVQPPWLKLEVGRRLTIEDNSLSAILGHPKRPQYYRGGAFFRGLARPWQGLHTIDTLRRDAARMGLDFQTELHSGKNEACVRVAGTSMDIVYRILMNQDLIEEISFQSAEGLQGCWRFSYPDPSEEKNVDPTPASIPLSPKLNSRDRKSGSFWLEQLADGTLGS